MIRLTPSDPQPMLNKVPVVTLVFWPAVYYLRLAPDLSDQVHMVLGRIRNKS